MVSSRNYVWHCRCPAHLGALRVFGGGADQATSVSESGPRGYFDHLSDSWHCLHSRLFRETGNRG